MAKTINFGESFILKAKVDWKLEDEVMDALEDAGFDPTANEDVFTDDVIIRVPVNASSVSSAHSIIENIVR